MPVNFNTFEEVGDQKFIFKHLDQPYLYLIIEYTTQTPSFFCPSLKTKTVTCSYNDKTIELKFLKSYECPSKILAQKTPLPWGAYVATLNAHGNLYHFVYEITDPQGQMQATQSFEAIFKSKTFEDFKRCPLFSPIENVFSDTNLFGKVISYHLKLPSQRIAPLQNKIKLSATLTAHQYDLYANRCEEAPPPLSGAHSFQARLIQPKAKFLKKPSPAKAASFG